MNEALEQLRAAIVHADGCVEAVSAWSVAHHIEHCCLAMERICGAVAESTPPPEGKRTALGVLVFKLGKIPRGRGKAPEASIPKHLPSQAELLAHLDRAEQTLERTGQLDPDAWFKHFVFGTMRRDHAIAFLDIHNRHHLKIIDDIVKHSGT